MINRISTYIALIILMMIVSCKPSTNSDKSSDANNQSKKEIKDKITNSTCDKDVDFVSDKGHQYRERSMGTLQQMFKAAKQKDSDGFMAVATDPYIQHSPDLPDGMKPVWDLLINRPASFSNKQIQWIGEKGFLDNGNFLIMFREVNRGDGTGLSKIVDIMRFDDEGKYAEHWDIRQPLAEKTKSGHSETGTAKKFLDNPVSYSKKEEEKNKKRAVRYLNHAFNIGPLDKALEAFAAPDYVQHNPMLPDGTKPLIGFFKSGKLPVHCYDIKHVFAQNDLVVVFSKVTTDGKIEAIVDIYRMRDGKMVEHWDIVQPVPADTDMPHKNGMF